MVVGEMIMNKIELLAPAGSMESLYAAVQNGADAVYLGGNKFSARAYASNFGEEEMTKAVEYCHIYGVKVYVTLNTLLKENEVNEALNYAAFLYSIGVDGIIIQDTGLAALINKNLPDLELHASTQMTVHNGEGALFLKDLGFKRIVLSRELSIKEIKHISTDLGVETEIFVHGALCICYSGQCLMSSLIGGRSGNRGRCAQPCRLPYKLINKKEGKETSAYILSPKDICTIENIKDIIESGTASLKIEGRMKRPEYVAGVVDIYRRAIDSVYNKKEFHFAKEKAVLMKLFNREGFSKAYMVGNPGKSLMAYSCPKNTGVFLGKVGKGQELVLEDSVSLKDGVRYNEEGFTVSKIIKDGKEVEAAFKGDKVKLFPLGYKSGEYLYKNSDVKLLEELSQSYKNPYGRKLPLSLEVDFKVEEPITIKANYDNKEFIAVGEVVQKALKKPLDKEKLKENLGKTGDTAFEFKNIIFNAYEEGFLPVSSVNAVRRELMESIEGYIKNKDKKDISNYKLNFHKENRREEDSMPSILVCVNSKEGYRAVKDSGIEDIAVNIFTRGSSIIMKDVKNDNVYLKIPNIIKEEFEVICNTIEENLPYIKGIVTANLGIINRFRGRTSIIGDYKLNIFNSFSLNFYNNFLQGSSFSVELNKKEIGELLKGEAVNSQMLIYGKPELMVSEYCPIGSIFGGWDMEKTCSRACEKGSYVLKDRKNEEFLVTTDKFCRSYIYNNSPINLIGNMEEIKKLGVKSFRLDFTDESYEEIIYVMKQFKEEKWQGDFNNYTRGHFKRGVE